MRRFTLASLAVLLLLLSSSQRGVQADQALYTIDNLGKTADGLVPTVTGTNASGQVSGYVDSPSGSHAVRYTNGHGWEYLPGLNTTFSIANGINANGDVVGYRINPANQTRAFRYRDGSGIEDIAPLAGGSMTVGYGINDAGDIVGYADTPSGIVGFRAAAGLPAVALPDLGGGFTLACGINAAGQVAGFSYTPEGFQHAVRIEPDGSVLDFRSFDGPSGYSAACAIDADGRVGGQADDHAVARAFVYAGNLVKPVDTFGSAGSNVEAIAAGRSVGWYSLANGSMRAFTHTDTNGSVDLNG